MFDFVDYKSRSSQYFVAVAEKIVAAVAEKIVAAVAEKIVAVGRAFVVAGKFVVDGTAVVAVGMAAEVVVAD